MFLIPPKDLSSRLDCAYHTPSFRAFLEEIEQRRAAGQHTIKHIVDFVQAPKLNRANTPADSVFRYVDIGAIDAERCEIIESEIQEGTVDELPDRARILVQTNDVIFPLSYDSLGKVAIIPPSLDGQLVSSGFIGIRCVDEDEALLLWSLLRSETMQKQFRHIASGYTQRGISKDSVSELQFPIPLAQAMLIPKIRALRDKASSARDAELTAPQQHRPPNGKLITRLGREL